MAGAPYFSLVTPMYNRAGQIRRAIDSCLAQTDPDFELLVVDDCSTDESAAIVAGYADPRVRLLRHAENRGPCPARNTAIAAARGRWCVMVDSDFELLPEALVVLRERTARAPASVGNVASSCRWDDGSVSPRPFAGTRVLDFAGWLAWARTVTVSEKLECIRRVVFERIRYPDSRAWEFTFHLDLAAAWEHEISDRVLVAVHSDAPNRLTAAAGPAAVERVLRDAPDKLASFEAALARHGAALDRLSPPTAEYLRTLAAAQAVLAGERGRALALVRRILAGHPGSRQAWMAAALALLGRRQAAWAMVQRRRWRG